MTTRNSTSRLQRWFIANLLVFGCITGARAQTLANDLVAYWPLDEVQGNKTPDLVSGYDMTLNNLTTNDLVAGVSGNCFSFSNARQTLLSRVHSASEDLPINKHDAFARKITRQNTSTANNAYPVFS